jgi:transposase
MRYVKLKEEEIVELNKLYKTSTNSIVRIRSQCLLLSNSGLQIKELSKISGARSRAIRTWFDKWELLSYQGLQVQLGRGAKKKLENVPKDELKELVRMNSRNLNSVISELEKRYKVAVSTTTLQRHLKNMGI